MIIRATSICLAIIVFLIQIPGVVMQNSITTLSSTIKNLNHSGDPNSIVLHWTVTDQIYTSYSIQYNETSTNIPGEITVAGDNVVVEANIGGLFPGLMYSIGVIGMTSLDVKLLLIEGFLTTAPLPPVNVSGEAAGSDWLFITWTPHPDSHQDSYNILITDMSRFSMQNIPRHSKSHVNLTNLSPGHAYQVLLTAVSHDVSSQAVNHADSTDQEIIFESLATPSGLQSGSSASHGQHKLPGQNAQQSINVPINCIHVDVFKEYAIKGAFLSKQSIVRSMSYEGQPPEHIIIKSTDFQNAAQQGVTIQWKHLFMPLSPVISEVRAVNSTTMLVSWTPDTGSLQDEFSVRYRGDSNSKSFAAVCDPSDADNSCSFNIDAPLKPGQKILIDVAAVAGQRSSLAAQGEGNMKPLAASDLELDGTLTDSASVRWFYPAPDISVISSFSVSLFRLDELQLSVTLDPRYDFMDFDDLKPGHEYKVRVVALSGTEESEPETLSFNTKPEDIDFLRLTDQAQTSVRVSWGQPVTSHVDSFSVAITKVGFATLKPLVVTGTEVLVTGLHPGCYYDFRVRARSGQQQSVVVHQGTHTLTVSPHAQTVTAGALTVSWHIPDGPPYKYFNLTLTGEEYNNEISFTLDNKIDEYLFGGLQPGRLYQSGFSISYDDGSTSTPAILNIITKPLTVIGLSAQDIGTTNLTLVWDTDANSVQDGFKIEYTDIDTNKTYVHPKVASVPFQAYSVVISGLIAGHQYLFVVAAYRDYSDISGQLKPAFSLDAEYAVIMKPKPVSVLRISNIGTQIYVTWTVALDSSEDSYEIRHKAILRNLVAPWLTSITTLTSFTIDAFPGEKFMFVVRARRNETLSDESAGYIIIKPISPSRVSVVSELTTGSSLVLQWNYDSSITFLREWLIEYTSHEGESGNTTIPGYGHTGEVAGRVEMLSPGQTYNLVVTAVTDESVKSDYFASTSGTVKPIVTTNIGEIASTNSSLSLTYTNNSHYFDGYEFTVPKLDFNITQLRGDPPDIYLQNLEAGQTYLMFARVFSGNLYSRKKRFEFTTLPNIPTVSASVASRTVNITINKPRGRVEWYSLRCVEDSLRRPCGTHQVDHIKEDVVFVPFDGLSPFHSYTFYVASVSRGKEAATSVSVTTEQAAPGAVSELHVTESAPRAVLVQWSTPHEPNGIILQYELTYGIDTDWPMERNQQLLDQSETSYTLSDLDAGRTYKFEVRARTIEFGHVAVKVYQLATYQPKLRDDRRDEMKPLKVERPTKPNTMTLRFANVFSDEHGEIIFYTVIVATNKSSSHKEHAHLPSWKTAQNDPAVKVYQTLQNCSNFFDSTSTCGGQDANMITARRKREALDYQEFTVGAEKDCLVKQGYCNGPLKPNMQYYIALRAFTTGGFKDTDFSDVIKTAVTREEPSDNGVMIGVIVGVVVVVALLAIVGGIIFWRHKRQPYKKNTETVLDESGSIKLDLHRTPTKKVKTNHIVKLEDFPEHFRLMAADSDYRFAEEFEALREIGRDQYCIAAELPQNRAKNRFTNILPVDQSRVKLLPTDDEEGSDYINANYIPGLNSRREYIATQGPLASTRDDFWRMIWEQNTCNVVMLTKCVEKGREKCDQYWPTTSEPMFYGDLQVAALNETVHLEWIITEFRISLGEQTRKVRHFHFTGWPDFGVPEKPQSLVRFVKAVRDKLSFETGGPIVVHCSAGVGRSGTFIALDWILQEIRHRETVDIYGIVYEMRKERVFMVQTEQQYICIHQCLLSVLQGLEQEPTYCNEVHENDAYEDDEGINVEIM